VISKEDIWFVAHCVELGVVSHGKTIEEAQANLKEAVELHIESFGAEEIPGSSSEVMFSPLEIAVNAQASHPFNLNLSIAENPPFGKGGKGGFPRRAYTNNPPPPPL